MRFPPTLTLLAVSSVVSAQNISINPLGKMGVFAANDGSKTFDTLPATSSLTTTTPLSVIAQSPRSSNPVAHARTKASLRMLDGLPVMRVHEAGFLTPVPNPRTRAVGTTDDSTAVGTSLRPHAWLLTYTGRPGDRIRVHSRIRSATSGSASISGTARVDVGADGSFEFDHRLNGRRFLGNKSITLGSNGELKIAIETSTLLTSNARDAAAFQMTLDVSLEPVQGHVASFFPVGEPCGADLYGVSWVTSNERYSRIVLENAAANALTFLMLGWARIDLTMPGATCKLLASPAVLLPTRTNPVGRVITDLPPIPHLSVGAAYLQHATLPPSGLQLSKSLLFSARFSSDKAHEPYDLNHILSAGQSLALGGLGSPVLSTTQKYRNQMFDTGLRSQSNRLAPLVESTWETMSSGMSDTVSNLHRQQYNNDGRTPIYSHDQIISIHAEPGFAYPQLRKGTQAFNNGLNQHRLAQLIADQQRKSYVVRCVTVVHGEEDHQRVNPTYSRDIIEWQRDYEEAIQSRGQALPVPMFHSQLSSYSSFQSAWSFIPTEQLKATTINPRKNVLVTPKYIFTYNDGIHLTSSSYRWMGEYYGKVYNHVILEGQTWEPLRPLTIERAGAIIRVRFHVPEPPLVFDTTAVTNPGNLGFEYSDVSGNTPAIQSVRLVDEDTVEITLDAAPNPTVAKTLGYAYTAIPGQLSGPISGARGNLRDSDATPSLHGSKLHNWCVHFQESFQ